MDKNILSFNHHAMIIDKNGENTLGSQKFFPRPIVNEFIRFLLFLLFSQPSFRKKYQIQRLQSYLENLSQINLISLIQLRILNFDRVLNSIF
jgi:hypothetical protein